MANKNKQRREKKKRRLKHPELGRAKVPTSSRTYSQSDNKKPKSCDKCTRKFINYLFIGGRIIKNVCGCTEYLLEIEANRIQEKRRQRELNRPIKLGQIRIGR